MLTFVENAISATGIIFTSHVEIRKFVILVHLLVSLIKLEFFKSKNEMQLKNLCIFGVINLSDRCSRKIVLTDRYAIAFKCNYSIDPYYLHHASLCHFISLQSSNA